MVFVVLSTLWPADRLLQLFDRDARVPRERNCRVFIGVEFADVDVNEAHSRILKRSFRCSGEIAITRSDANDQVSFAGKDIRAGRAGHSNGADILRVVKGQRAFTSLVSHTGIPVACANLASASEAPE